MNTSDRREMHGREVGGNEPARIVDIYGDPSRYEPTLSQFFFYLLWLAVSFEEGVKEIERIWVCRHR